MIRYLDASAHAKAYVEEEGSDLVRRWMRSGTCWTSRLGLVEVHSALIRRSRAGHITRRDLGRILAAVDADARDMPIAEFDEAVHHAACRLLRKHPLRGADAVHVATALELAGRLGGLVVASWDDRFIEAARALGLTVEGG